MNHSDSMIRFDELSAGRSMGDLCSEEEREFILLEKEFGTDVDNTFELLVASIEVNYHRALGAVLPVGLATRFHGYANEISKNDVANILTPSIPSWRNRLFHPASGWVAAAAVVLAAVIIFRDADNISPALAETKLRGDSHDLIEHQFSGLGDFKEAGGKVIWSDQFQQGYMTLSGIPANDPKQAQYQLWIVDPERDEAPIDGGVFDIPAGGATVVIPIVAKLSLTQPQAFVITLEQPGGVVKSKQLRPVALAKG